jgi:hypothetical protein
MSVYRVVPAGSAFFIIGTHRYNIQDRLGEKYWKHEAYAVLLKCMHGRYAMKNTRHSRNSAIAPKTFLILSGVLVFSCTDLLSPSSERNTSDISVTVSTDSDITASWSEQIQEVTITGHGPEGSSINASSVNQGTPVSFEVTPGTWTIEITAYDASSTVIGHGEASVDLEAGETRRVTIALQEIIELLPTRVIVDLSGFGPYYTEGYCYDLIDASQYNPALTYDGIDSQQTFNDWYSHESVVLVQADGETPVLKQGNRTPLENLAGGGVDEYVIEGLAPEKTWMILITTWYNRTETPPDAMEFFFGDAYLSDPFTTSGDGEDHSVNSTAFVYKFWSY